VIIVLNKTECLQELLEEFSERKLQGATVISSHGMMQELSEEDELRFILSLRHILNPEHKENRTIFMAASESKVPIIIEAVNKVTGGLDKGDTGILFTVPIDYLEGFKVHD
jgi:formyltetrahydrofolate hydrolase